MTPLVQPLLSVRCPTAVTGFVIAIWIYAIECISPAWAFSHVGKEVSEIIPVRTHFNAAPTVEVEPIAIGIAASKSGSLPRNVCPTDSLLVAAMSMASRRIASSFSVEAATRTGVPTFEVTGGGNDFISAFASAVPVSITVLGEGKVFDRQPTERFAFDICAHGEILNEKSKFIYGWLDKRVGL